MKPPVYHSFLSLSFLAAVLLIATHNSQAQTASAAGVEDYILAQLTAGETADLEQKFPNASDRVVSAGFLEGVIINPGQKYQIHRLGVSLKGAIVRDRIDLANSEVEKGLYFESCHFNEVRFTQAVFRKSLIIKTSTFGGIARFNYATIVGGLQIIGSHFNGLERSVDFQATKVAGPALITGCTFAGSGVFSYLTINGVLQMTRSFFVSATATAVFNSMKIDSSFFLDESTFQGPVDMVNVSVGGNFDATNTHFNSPDGEVTFDLEISRHFHLEKATFAGPVSFANTVVHGRIGLEMATFAKPPVLTNLQYDRMTRENSLDFVRMSDSDYSAYDTLESSFQKYGQTSNADEVHIAKRRLQRRQTTHPWEKVMSFLSDGLQGFGRRPYLVLLWDLGVIAVGMIVFNRTKMIPKDNSSNKSDAANQSDRSRPKYNSFWYSATLFTPKAESDVTKTWQPAPKHRKTSFYVKMHKFLGWLLVPGTILLWTGIFK